MIFRGKSSVDLLVYVIALKGHYGLTPSLNMQARRVGIS
jgi:hypothetical protein